MSYQRGSLKRASRKAGDIWVLRYRVNTADGRRVESTLPVGLIRDLPTEKSAWREVDRLGLLIRINCEAPSPARSRFDALAEHYLRVEFGPDAMRPKSEGTTLNMNHIVRDYLIPRFGKEIAEDIKPLDIQRWLKSLHDDKELAWSTVSKIRTVMLRIFKTGILHSLISVNPVQPVETRSTTNYRPIILSPRQTIAILQLMSNDLYYYLVLTCAATALRASELVALRWSDILWDEGRIRISKRWSKGKEGKTKTARSDGYVPLHPILAQALLDWRSRTPYAEDSDFLFPSYKGHGKIPLSPGIFAQNHLRTVAIRVGVAVPDGHRFGLHNLRHSLSTWMVNKAKINPKTAQNLLRHSRSSTTMDLYVHQDGDETRAAQGEFLKALGMTSQAVQ